MVTIAILLSAGLVFGRVQTASTVTLKLAPPVGKTYKYRATASTKMTGSTTSPDTDATVACEMAMKVTRRSEEVTSFETRMSKVSISTPAGGPTTSAIRDFERQLSAMVTHSKFDGHGHLISNDDMGLQVVCQSFTYIGYPARPVHIGQSWNSTLDVSKMGGSSSQSETGGKIPILLRLEKLEKLGGNTIAELSVKINGDTTMGGLDGPSIHIHMESTTDAFIDVSDGMPISLSSDIVSTAKASNVKITQRHKQSLKRM